MSVTPFLITAFTLLYLLKMSLIMEDVPQDPQSLESSWFGAFSTASENHWEEKGRTSCFCYLIWLVFWLIRLWGRYQYCPRGLLPHPQLQNLQWPVAESIFKITSTSQSSFTKRPWPFSSLICSSSLLETIL